MSLALQGVTKVVGRETHLYGIDLTLEPGSRNVLLGRTLAGKTSLLRLMAGLDRPTDGRVLVDGKDVTGVSVRNRNIAMVYQQFVNYPSLKVFDNIASPLKIGGTPKAEIEKRVREAAEMLHIDHLLDRLPAELSGGQQQRTAIARALVKEAQLLLLDEPLVNLDYKLREELRTELSEIFKSRKALVVYTTTEPSEALMLGGNVVVMDEGRVLQTGPTAEVYQNPANTKVAEVFSDPPINFIEAAVTGKEALLGGDVRLPLEGALAQLPEGDYRFGFRSNHLSLFKTGETDVLMEGTVDMAEVNGSESFIHVIHPQTSAHFVIQEEGVHKHAMGSTLSFYINPKKLFVFDSEGGLVTAPGRV